MLIQALSAMILLLGLMLAWIQVQRMARHVAEEHPEAGPLRLVGGGCGGHNHGEPPAALKAAPVKPSAKPSAEGCAACDNIACKPGRPPALGGAETQPLP